MNDPIDRQAAIDAIDILKRNYPSRMTTNRIIELLGEIRAEYNCFDENECEKYEALSEAIRKLKPREYTKLVPCVCGCKRRHLWYHTAKGGINYECIKCSRMSPLGKTEEEARKNWNEYISKLKGEQQIDELGNV